MRYIVPYLVFVLGCAGSSPHTKSSTNQSDNAQGKSPNRPSNTPKPPLQFTHPTSATALPYSEFSPPSTDRLDEHVVPQRYRIRLDVNPEKEGYSGIVEVDLLLKKPTKTIRLHSEAHTITQASITLNDGTSVTGVTVARGQPDWLAINAPQNLASGSLTLRLEFGGAMTHKLVGMYRVQHENRWYVYTQFEALDARKAFPCFDEPGFKTPYEMTYVTPKDIKAFSNSPLNTKTQIDDHRVAWSFKPTPPLPSYLVATAIGPLDVAEKKTAHLQRDDGSVLPIRILTVHGRKKDAEYALDEAARVVAIQETYFGIKYPYAKLDLVAVPDFAAGAMENAGLITYRDRKLLMDRRTATEDELRGYISIHAHEVAHMWFGDLVTMTWWDDLWLNEAFATWFARKVSHVYRPDWKTEFELIRGRKWVMDQDSTTKARRMREPIKRRGDIKNAFDGITYTKGAAVLDMFERYVGEDVFRDGVRLYMNRHAWGSATYDNLIDAIAEKSGKAGLKEAMATFIDQAGVPHLHVEPQACVDGKRTLKIRQKRWQPLGGGHLKPGHWHVPFCLRSLGTQTEVCDVISAKEKIITVEDCAGVILPNSGAGGYLIWSTPDEHLDAIIKKIGQLTAYEKVNLMTNLTKLYQSGDAQPRLLIALAKALLQVKSDRIRKAALEMAAQFGELVTDTDRPAWNRFMDGLIAPLLSESDWEKNGRESREKWALKRAVLRIAGLQGHRSNVLNQSRRIANDFLAKKTVVRELVGTAMTIDAQHGDERRFKTFVDALLNETDPSRRNTLVNALTSFRFSGFPQASFELAQNPKLRINERGRFIWAPASDYRTRRSAWTWLKANIPLVRNLLARGSARYLPYYPLSACRPEIKEEIVTVFQPLSSGPNQVSGLARHLSNAQNRLDQCLAKRKRYGQFIKDVLTKRP